MKSKLFVNMPAQTKACGISDVGLVRQNNEDTWAQIPELGFYILADGMGGHQAGEVASREAVESLSSDLQKAFRGASKSLNESLETIKECIIDVNTHVFKLGRASSKLKGMGTTLCLLHVHEEGVIYAHIGDSRIYRLREEKLELLTKDHSLLRELMDLGQISEQQSGEFYYKNIITKALGTEPHVEPSIEATELVPLDLYILCSDGLSDLLSLSEMEAILNRIKNLSEAADALVALSKMKGGHDNVTLLLVQIVP
jgi:serine/threonine protein phosphatase PrpC